MSRKGAGQRRRVEQHPWGEGQPYRQSLASPPECSASILSTAFSRTLTGLSHALTAPQEWPGLIHSDYQSYQLARTAIAKYHRPGASDHGHLFS